MVMMEGLDGGGGGFVWWLMFEIVVLEGLVGDEGFGWW